jgi:hypothetical protein
MKRTFIALVTILALAVPVIPQTPPPAPPPAPTDKKADPKKPEKAEQEPRPIEQELQKKASQEKDAPVAVPAPHPPGAVAPASEPEKKDEKKWDVNNPPGPSHDVAIDVTRDVAESRRLARRQGDRVRSPRRHLHDSDRRRRSESARHRHRVGHAAALLAERQMDRVHQRPRRRRQHLDHESRRLRREAGHEGKLPPAQRSRRGRPTANTIVARKHFTSERSLGAGEMWLYHRSGGDGLQMTKKRTDQKDTGEPVFSPDGKYLYFSDDVTPGAIFEYSKDPNGQIYVIQRLDRETGEIERYVFGPGGSIRPTPSPDGKSLAFIRRVRYKSTLFMRDLESGRETPLYDGLDRDMQETWAVHGVYPSMAWTPDNEVARVLGRRRDPSHRRRVEAGRRHPVPREGRARVRKRGAFPIDVAPNEFNVKMLRWVGGLAARQSGRLSGARLSLRSGFAERNAASPDEADGPLRVLPERGRATANRSSTRRGTTRSSAPCASRPRRAAKVASSPRNPATTRALVLAGRLAHRVSRDRRRLS